MAQFTAHKDAYSWFVHDAEYDVMALPSAIDQADAEGYAEEQNFQASITD